MRNTYGAKYYPCESCSRNQNPAGCVYITSTGNRYHNQETCSGLKRTIRLVKLSQVERICMPAAVADKKENILKELYTVFFWRQTAGWISGQEISLVLAGIYGISGIMYSIFTGRPIGDILIPAGIGMMFLAAGFLSRGTIGVGDGWILAALGTL